jgi:hypothetical protein
MASNFLELRAMVTANARMLDLYFWLRDAKALAGAAHSSNMHAGSNSVGIDCWAEADLKAGWSISYGIELSIHQESASIETSVLVQSPRGTDSQQDTLRETSAIVTTQEELVNALAVMAEDLWSCREQELERAMALARA